MPSTPVTIETPDGLMDAVLCRPSSGGPWPAILLYMDAMGVRPDLVGMAERLSAMGYVVLVGNLFYRSGPQPAVNPAAFAVPGPERDRVFALIQSLDHEKVMRDTQAMLDYLDTRDDVRKSRIGTLGYCMGGGYALTAAGRYPELVAGAAAFHAAWLATDRPDSPHLLAPKMRAKLYVGVAGIDPMFPDQERERLRQALEDARCDFELKVYPDVRHGFSVTGHPVYDRDASEEHWRVLARFFPQALGA